MLSTKCTMELRSRSKRMLCLVSLPDSTVFEIDFDSQSDGLEILDKVCEKLGLVEADFFGLVQPSCRKGERLWLNLRNRVQYEVSGSQPYRLEFRVKFFIPPHMIQQDVTRNHFYLNVREAFTLGRLRVPSREMIAQMAALFAQADIGDATEMMDDAARRSYVRLLPCGVDWNNDDDMLATVAAKHSKLSGTLQNSAKYQLLQAAAELPLYNSCFHDARIDSSPVHIAVGSDGVVFFDKNWLEMKRIDYSAVQLLTHDGSSVLLEITDDNFSRLSYTLRLSSRLTAGALYRAMTEKYYFYHCDTVGRDVMSQYCRDLKGTLASLFKEDTDLGKSYVFDIQRTLSEAYDRVRRLLYVRNNSASESSTDVSCMSPARKLSRVGSQSSVLSSSASDDRMCSSRHHCDHCQEIHDILQQYEDSMKCHMCADNRIDTALVPCGHTMCCSVCAVRLELCPLCKVSIGQRLKIFLPYVHSTAIVPGEQNLLCAA